MKFGEVEVFNSNDFPYGKLIKDLTKAKYNMKNGKKLANYVCSFDTETTNIELNGKKQAFVYLWGFSFENKYYCIGRTMTEFMEFINNLIDFLSMYEINIAIYCHNLSFDYMFIFDFIEEQYNNCKTFNTDRNDVVTYDIPYIQFRCSKKLTNLKLDQACKKFGLEIGKLNQDENNLDLDYSIIRTTETKLNLNEQNYFIHDIQAVVLLVHKLLDLYDDTIKSIPLTATGYVRRKCRRVCLDDDKFVYNFRKLDLTPEVYYMLQDNIKGGNAHGNRFCYNEVIENAKSVDFLSAYVYEMLNKYVPMSKFYEHKNFTTEEFEKYLDSYCCLFDVKIDHIKLVDFDNWDCLSKSWILNHGHTDYKPEYITEDNGRIVEARNIKLCLNELDFKEIKRHYIIEGLEVGQLYTAFRGRLPYQLRNLIFEYFKKKEDCKIYKGTELNYLYQNAKEEVLAIFGMMLTKIIHESWTIDKKQKKWSKIDNTNSDIYYTLHDYFKTQKRVHFNYPAWGNWIVSHCRNDLEQLATCFRKPVYHDTDCVKGVGLDQKRLDEYNKRVIEINKKHGYMYKDICPGLAIIEYTYDQFIHLGAKRYMYKLNNEIHIAIAGCYKKCGNQIKDLSKINLDENKVTFTNATVIAKHNIEDIHEIEVNGVKILTASNVYLENSNYTLAHYKDFYDKAGILRPGKTY